jgi:hypothetical protein
MRPISKARLVSSNLDQAAADTGSGISCDLGR